MKRRNAMADPRDQHISVPVNGAERAKLEKAARAEHLPLATFIRKSAIDAAEAAKA